MGTEQKSPLANLEAIKNILILLLFLTCAVAVTYALVKPPKVEIKEVRTEVPKLIEKIVPETITVEKVKYIPVEKIKEVYINNDKVDSLPALPTDPNEKVIAVKEFDVPVPAHLVATGTLNVETGQGDILVKQYPIKLGDSNLAANADFNKKTGQWGFFKGTEAYMDFNTHGTQYGVKQNLARASFLRVDAYAEGGTYEMQTVTGTITDKDVVVGVQGVVELSTLKNLFTK